MADVLREKPCDAQACIAAGRALTVGTARKNPHPESKDYALVPKDHDLVYLEQPGFPLRRKGTVKLSDTASFLEYWKRQSDGASYIYGSMVPAQFLAVFNEHHKADSTESSGADWRDHRALYALTHSDEWTTWTKCSGQPFDGNESFAYWLEENLFDIRKPDPAKFMDIALNMRVKQGQVFGNKVNLNDGNIVLEYTNAVEGSAQSAGGGKLSIPEKFEISIPVFKGLDAKRYTIEARFRYRLSNGALKIQYDLIRPAKVMEQAFKDMLAEIEKAAKTAVLFGTPE
jgi:uncharacterized protein YfdQ (DUF2303 family)